MQPLAIPGYIVAAASLFASAEGTPATSLILAVPAAGGSRQPVVIGRWNYETGILSERQAFHDIPDPATAPALARAYTVYAQRLGAEALMILNRRDPLGPALQAPLLLGHDHARGMRAARRKSLDELGHAGWADTIVGAYVDPFGTWAALDAAGADKVEYEELW